jgi:hypothetical protein
VHIYKTFKTKHTLHLRFVLIISIELYQKAEYDECLYLQLITVYYQRLVTYVLLQSYIWTKYVNRSRIEGLQSRKLTFRTTVKKRVKLPKITVLLRTVWAFILIIDAFHWNFRVLRESTELILKFCSLTLATYNVSSFISYGIRIQ